MPMWRTGTSIRDSGFTLVELIVVIIVLSLVSLLSLPFLSRHGDGDERLVIRRLAGTVKHLYNEATLTRDEHRLVFDFNRNSISTLRLRSRSDGTEAEPVGRELLLEPLKLVQVDVEGKGSFRTGQVTVRVLPLGWMEQTRLLMTKVNGAEIELNFSPLTGSVTIDDEFATVQ